MADTKLTALSELSVLALDDLAYVVDDPAGTPVSNKISQNRVGGLLNRGVCQGRLTTESGVPVSTSDRTAQGTLYFTPYNGNLLTVYDGTRWKLYTFSELSLALTVTSGSNYDVFVYDNAGALTLELSAAWTDGTTRADAVSLQDGVYVKTGATTRRLLGTIRASGSNVTEDSRQNRLICNLANAVWREVAASEGTSHTYGTGTWREWRNGTGSQRVSFVTTFAVSEFAGIYAQTQASAFMNIGLDSTSSPYYAASTANNNAAEVGTGRVAMATPTTPGYHQLIPLEYGGGAAQFNYYELDGAVLQ